MVISAILKYHTFSVKLILQINSSSYDNQFSYKKSNSLQISFIEKFITFFNNERQV